MNKHLTPDDIAWPLGNRVLDRVYQPELDILGSVTKTGAGNTVLLLGRLRDDDSWEQTAQVYLTPIEREALIAALTRHRD